MLSYVRVIKKKLNEVCILNIVFDQLSRVPLSSGFIAFLLKNFKFIAFFLN